MKCLNLPTKATVYPKQPYLVIVNRPPSVGRSFLNIEKLVTLLKVSSDREDFPTDLSSCTPLNHQVHLSLLLPAIWP